MGSGRGNNSQETNLQNQAQAATNAIQPSEFETYWNTRNMNLLKGLDSGKDVKDIAELAPHLDLYNSSVANNQNYAGEGLLAPNALSGGNAAQLGLISKQIADRRQTQAAGDLYNGVQDARSAATAGGQWGAELADRRNISKADITNQRYTAYLNRPKKTPFWQSLLLGGMQAGAQLGSAAIAA